MSTEMSLNVLDVIHNLSRFGSETFKLLIDSKSLPVWLILNWFKNPFVASYDISPYSKWCDFIDSKSVPVLLILNWLKIQFIPVIFLPILNEVTINIVKCSS